MRFSLRLVCGLWAVILAWTGPLPAGPAASSRPLRVGVETHAAPFTFSDGDHQPAGFAVDLMQEVARDQGLQVEFKLMDWEPLFEAFKAGDIDIICNLADTEDRRSFIDFTSTTMSMHGAVFARRDGPPVASTADLARLRIAVPRDSRAHEYLKRQSWSGNLVFIPTLLDCVRAVHEHRADVFLSSDLVASYVIRNDSFNDVVQAPISLPELDYREHFGIRSGQPALLAKLNEGLLSVHRQHIYEQLYEKWIGPIQVRRLRFRDILPYVLPLVILLLAGGAGLFWQRHTLAQVKRQAEALRRSEEQLSRVLQGSQDGFWDWDVRTGRQERSERWATMLGYRPDELATTRTAFISLIHPDDRPIVAKEEQSFWSGREEFAMEFRMRAKSGEWRWILDRAKIVQRDPLTGAPWRIAGTHTDITARKLAETENDALQRKMLETQKLESLGVLAGGIAHDFNNLLTAILGNASLLQMDLAKDGPKSAQVGKILVATRRAADLCRQLLAYAGKGAVVVERLNLSRVVQDTTRLLELSLHHAELTFALAPSLPSVEADVSQLRQVIMNLVLNAAEALGDKPGRINVSTRTVVLKARELRDALPGGSPPPGEYVCLEVSDTGCGMTPEVRAKIFDPFFTTKFTGRGLGLAAVLGIVRTQHGALTVMSTPGQGSTFAIYLPCVAGHAEPLTQSPFMPPLSRVAAGSTVLVADDDASIRQLADNILRRAGYEVVLADDGESALQAFEAEPHRFHAGVFDVTMPRLDGTVALERIRARHPNFPCILFSGHSEEDAKGEHARHARTAFVQKPFPPESLIDTLLRLTKMA
ncbi:MAG TPA: transporter substrate-binding domain-containing protein [Candidatus Didemnitutus sp.]|nr:transporter substrate-binding domain-containing protein [Candidatus Didemnitutus sp.]